MSIKEYILTRKIELIIILLLLVVTIFLGYKLTLKEEVKVDNLIVDNSLNEEEPKEETSTIKVDIKGAVKKPGVYELDSNSRVIDAINKAGGLTTKASTKYINLSKKLSDENIIIISKTTELKKVEEKTNIEEITINTNTSNDASIKMEDLITNEVVEEPKEEVKETTTETTKVVNINTATKEELMTLSNVGESKAIKIIEYRTTNGNFKSTDEIKNVSGIGDKLYDSIKENITI